MSAGRAGIRFALRRILLTPGEAVRMDFDLKVNRLRELPECAHLLYGPPRPRREHIKLCEGARKLRRWMAAHPAAERHR